MTRSLKGPQIQRLKSQPAPAAQSQSEGVYGTAIERTTAGINKPEGRHDERANQVREYVAAGLSDDGDGQPLGLRGWNGQET